VITSERSDRDDVVLRAVPTATGGEPPVGGFLPGELVWDTDEDRAAIVTAEADAVETVSVAYIDATRKHDDLAWVINAHGHLTIPGRVPQHTRRAERLRRL
jgi:hypothetical protein